MIELFFKQIIDELGTTGLLIVGLYFFLYRPLDKMSRHIHTINRELGQIVTLLKEK